MNIHIIIILITCVISIAAFSSSALMMRGQLNAWAVVRHKEYYRAISYGFLHGDWMHLLINMFVLYSFGSATIRSYNGVFEGNNEMRFLLLYLSAIPLSSLYSIYKYRNNPNYNAVGASGAVSAIVYTTIFLKPYNLLYFWAIPIPGIVFGVAYLVYSWVMAKRNVDNIGHDAHFWGAVYGFVFPCLYKPALVIDFFKELLFIN